MSKLVCVLILLTFFSGQAQADQQVWVKYLNKTVDVDKPYFEYQDTSRSSFIGGAWYDKSKRYMIIKLKETHYHYCGMPPTTWDIFKSCSSFGKCFDRMIKGRYDCRVNPVPGYD